MSLTLEQIAEIVHQYQVLSTASSVARELGIVFSAQRILFKTSDGKEIRGFYDAASKNYEDGFLSSGNLAITDFARESDHAGLAVRYFAFSDIVDVTPVDPKFLEEAERINKEYQIGRAHV